MEALVSLSQIRGEQTGSAEILNTGGSCWEEGVGLIGEGGKNGGSGSGASFQTTCRSVTNIGGYGCGEETLNLV